MSGGINTGGTAFPMQDPQAIHAYAAGRIANIPAEQVDERDRAYLAARFEAVGGMTLRDYFAAKALQGLLSDTNVQAPRSEFAAEAYAMADEMLRVREGGAA